MAAPPNDQVAKCEGVDDRFALPIDRRSREERLLKLAGYSDAQIAKLLARTVGAADGPERRAA